MSMRSQRGVAMVIVMWVILVLSLLIAGFAFTMHVEMQVASFSRKQLKAQMLARGGFEVARMQLILAATKRREPYDGLNQDWATNETLFVDHELGEGKYNVKVADEERKLPINSLDENQLKHLVTLTGIDPLDGDVIVDSIQDWREKNDLHRLNGADNEYYNSLSPPYNAKHAPLDRVEELLLVRGVTREYFVGTPGTPDDPGVPGLKDLLTTTTSGHVNVNTASSLVLQILLGVDESRLQTALTIRDGPDGIPGTDDDQPFSNTGLFGTMPGAQHVEELAVTSEFFRITSTGEVGGAKRTITAIVHRQPGSSNVDIVMWNETPGGGT
jgi:general secretion pathway protein K